MTDQGLIERTSPVVEAGSLNHWTARKVLNTVF